MPAFSPELENHKAWLGYLQPDGVVVTAQTLVDAGVQIDRGQLPDLQERFIALTTRLTWGEDKDAVGIGNLPLFFEEFLGWLPSHLIGDLRPEPIPENLIVALPDFDETLTPTSALWKFQPKPDDNPWSLLIQKIPTGQDLDHPHAIRARGWEASPTKKFERLLRETKAHVGLLTNGLQFRLMYAPAKENAGHVTFPVQAMTEIGGRLILGAFHLLLGAQSVLNAPDKRHLHRLLAQSREYQATVSEQLAEQVLAALHELLRGFQSANDLSQGRVLRHPLAQDPHQIYEGLLSVLLRMVFLLFAEDRGLMPGGSVYGNHYGAHALFEKLRRDAEKHADHIDGRFGAWARLLAVFRIVHQGCRHGALKMPPRHGHLFDPDRFPFLEGRSPSEGSAPENLPLVSDGVVFRVLTNLLVLDGERISYRTLDVEEIGSVYQTIMGFGVLVSPGTAIALKGKRKNGSVPAAPIVVLEELLAQPAKERARWLKEKADHALTGEAEKALKAAATVDDCLAALSNRIDRTATPGPLHRGRLVLEPTDERRRSGSHYTPRSFTEPIVRKTLEPILKRFGETPTPAQILELKICDIAVGSAAFLVEVCRQFADVLVLAWRVHGGRPALPPDETEELLAMRLVAQRCLYGVDRNPMAVDLAKLSLWLATLAKDHPFTFVDHAIRCGDSLVGLTRQQIEDFTWGDTKSSQRQFFAEEVRKRAAAALRERQNLLGLGDDHSSPQLKREKLEKADELLNLVRFIGDACIAAFFSADKDQAREAKRDEFAEKVAEYLRTGNMKLRPTTELDDLRGRIRSGDGNGQSPSRIDPRRVSNPVLPFHWEVEFPEVFDGDNPGFDGIAGNPPFMGGNKISTTHGEAYRDWLGRLHRESTGSADLIAHFFRRAFEIMRKDGCFGLIATKTIGQGDTRSTGLRFICRQGGTVYSARKRQKWPGQAAVVVSAVNIIKGHLSGPYDLDARKVPVISAYLFHAGGHEDPVRLQPNFGKSYQGSILLGLGFLFEEGDPKGVASPASEMRRLVEQNPKTAERIFPYIGGEDINESPTHTPSRYAINFEQMNESQARQWPELMAIVEERVKPARLQQKRDVRSKYWWRYGEPAVALYAAIKPLPRVLAISAHTEHLGFAFIPARCVFSHALVVFPSAEQCLFTVLQSRPHEVWTRFLGSSIEDRLRYTPSDCFETFAFPAGYQTSASLEAAGREYYEFRAALMVDLWLGLTEIYNLFHAPDEEGLARLEALYRKRATSSEWRTAENVPENRSLPTAYPSPSAALSGVRRLRELHAAMDAAVLTAYGWEDLIPRCNCEFLLDYEDQDDEEEEGKTRKRKKPWRYRWPDDVRDEVLARLLKLNVERAEQECIQGLGDQAARGRRPRGRKISGASDDVPTLNL